MVRAVATNKEPMPNVYSVAPADVQKRVNRIRKKSYSFLDKAKVKIDVLFVTPQEEDDADPITQWGTPQPGKTRVIAQRDRGAGRGDAEIVLDARWYGEVSAAHQDAIIDRQLAFLAVKTDQEGDICLDGNGRPKLTMRKPDHMFAWFDDVAERHGDASVEVEQAQSLLGTKSGQLYFPEIGEPPIAFESNDKKSASGE
jgi:hypothetical protein